MNTTMTIEKALLSKARPYMLTAKVKAILQQEVSKGCLPEIMAQPVELEPVYQLISGNQQATDSDLTCHCVYEIPPTRMILYVCKSGPRQNRSVTGFGPNSCSNNFPRFAIESYSDSSAIRSGSGFRCSVTG